MREVYFWTKSPEVITNLSNYYSYNYKVDILRLIFIIIKYYFRQIIAIARSGNPIKDSIFRNNKSIVTPVTWCKGVYANMPIISQNRLHQSVNVKMLTYK